MNKPTPPQPCFSRASDIEPKPVHWLWRDRIPSAMLSLLVGIEGSGKTFLVLDMAARVSTGRPWPDAQTEQDWPDEQNAIILTAEDSLAHTIRPRLDAAKADCGRVFVMQAVKCRDEERPVDLTRHLPALETMIEQVGDVGLVIVDPLTAYLGATDQNVNSEVRAVLSALGGLAEKHGCAIVGVSHLCKDSSKRAIHRALGSVAFTASARAVWLVAKDPSDSDHERRLFVPVKLNLARPAKSLAFHVEGARARWDDGQFECDPDQVLTPDPQHENSTSVDDACQFLTECLKDGPVPSNEVLTVAKQQGITPGTLKRAKTKMGIKAIKSGFDKDAAWHWRLPAGEARRG